MKWKITYNTYSQQNILFLHFALLIHKNDVTLYFFYLNVYRFLCYIRGMSPIPCRFSKTRQRQYNVTIGFIVINMNISLPLSILHVISTSEWRNSPRKFWGLLGPDILSWGSVLWGGEWVGGESLLQARERGKHWGNSFSWIAIIFLKGRKHKQIP